MKPYCDRCRRRFTETRQPGPDCGASHNFCERCLDLLEMGQGFVDDTPIAMAEAKSLLRSCDDPQERKQWADTFRKAAAAYASDVGAKSPLRGDWPAAYDYV